MPYKPSPFQYCIHYSCKSPTRYSTKIFLCDSWNLCCTHSLISASGNFGAHSETWSGLILDIPLVSCSLLREMPKITVDKNSSSSWLCFVNSVINQFTGKSNQKDEKYYSPKFINKKKKTILGNLVLEKNLTSCKSFLKMFPDITGDTYNVNTKWITKKTRLLNPMHAKIQPVLWVIPCQIIQYFWVLTSLPLRFCSFFHYL